MTDAVIWRKMAAISDWISASVLSAGGACCGCCLVVGAAAVAGLVFSEEEVGGGAAFSWFSEVGLEEVCWVLDLDLEDFGVAIIWTC